MIEAHRACRCASAANRFRTQRFVVEENSPATGTWWRVVDAVSSPMSPQRRRITTYAFSKYDDGANSRERRFAERSRGWWGRRNPEARLDGGADLDRLRGWGTPALKERLPQPCGRDPAACARQTREDRRRYDGQYQPAAADRQVRRSGVEPRDGTRACVPAAIAALGLLLGEGGLVYLGT